MTVTNVEKDSDTLTLTMTSRYPDDVERIWRL